jgi:hypothetical protein
MLENNETPTSVEAVTIREGVDLEGRKATYEELEARLAMEVGRVTHFQRLYNESSNTINRACTAIQDVLAGDTDALETFESFREGFELLGVELMVERSWTVQATWTVTGKVPLDSSVDETDFEADLSTSWQSEIDDIEVSLDGISVDED